MQEAFQIVINPMADIRFIESIRNGTNVNAGSIKPSSILIAPQSQRNRVSFLCLPGGIGKGSNNSIGQKNNYKIEYLKNNFTKLPI